MEPFNHTIFKLCKIDCFWDEFEEIFFAFTERMPMRLLDSFKIKLSALKKKLLKEEFKHYLWIKNKKNDGEIGLIIFTVNKEKIVIHFFGILEEEIFEEIIEFLGFELMRFYKAKTLDILVNHLKIKGKKWTEDTFDRVLREKGFKVFCIAREHISRRFYTTYRKKKIKKLPIKKFLR